MFTLTRTESFAQEIRKSRFLAFAAPVGDEEAAKAFIAAHSHVDANHNCWAWRLGQVYRFSDDGEPSGTAGRPILQAIDGQELDGVAVVVTRWFGGILLGSGGLVRAYGGTASACLRQAEKSPLIATISGRIACLFSDLSLVKARLVAAGAMIEAEIFTESGAELSLRLPEEKAGEIVRLAGDLTSGRARLALPNASG